MASKLLRYRDIETRGIVNNRVTLDILIKKHGFPAGVMLSPNHRAWDEADIEKWLATRPPAGIAKPPLRGVVKRLAAQKNA